MELEKYIDPSYNGPTLIKGYLKKLKSKVSFSLIVSKFNKRYFILDLNNYFFGYQDREISSNFNRYELRNITNVHQNPRVTDVCDWRFAFSIEFKTRVFTLHTDSISIRSLWCKALIACIKPSNFVNEKISKPLSLLKPICNPLESENTQEKEKNEDVYDKKNNGIEERNKDVHGDDCNSFKDEKDNKMGGGFFKNLENSDELRCLESNSKDQGKCKNEFLTKSSYEVNRKHKTNFTHNTLKSVNLSEDEDISIISNPKAKIQKDDFDTLNLTAQIRLQSPQKSRFHKHLTIENPVSIKNPENLPWEVPKKIPIKANPIVFKANGIIDMIEEFNNLGLENVEIRTPSCVRQKLKPNHLLDTTKAFSKPRNTTASPIRILKIKKVTLNANKKKGDAFSMTQTFAKRNTETKSISPVKMANKHFDDLNDWDNDMKKDDEKKKNFGANIVKKVPVKFVEKPEILIDEEFSVSKSIRDDRKMLNKSEDVKNKAMFNEKTLDLVKRSDCDWDDWDN